MIYIMTQNLSVLITFNRYTDGDNYIDKAIKWCTDNNYEFISETRNSLDDLFWIVQPLQ